MKYSKKALLTAATAVLLLSGCSEIPSEPDKIEPTLTITTTTSAESISFTKSADEPLTADTVSETSDTVKTTEKVTTSEKTSVTTSESTTASETTTESAAETTALKPSIVVTDAANYNVIGESGILVSLQNGHYRGLMPCWGTYGYCDKYIADVNEFVKKLDNVSVYSMVIPTSAEFYMPVGFDNFTSSQKNKIDYIAEGLSGAESVDAYGALAAHADEDIYSRTDHHWFPLGGYYAAQTFAEKAGTDFASLDSYETVTRSGYVGSLYSYSKDVNLKNDPEDFTLYIPKNETKTTYYDTSFKNGYESSLIVASDASAYYCSFLGSDDRIAEIKTDCKNGRTLVIFKESYGNALVPFLTSSFENIYVCDLRYFTPNAVDFCKKVGATDLLFATCTFTPAGVNCKYMDTILQN